MRRTIREAVIWKAFWIILMFVPILFFWVLTLSNPVVSNIFLFLASTFMLLVLFITIPRWKKYYLTQYNYASKFAETLEIKTNELTSTLNHLNQNPLPKEIFWINFKIDPATLKIELETHSTIEESPLTYLEDIRNKVEALMAVNESTIADLRKQGWDAEENIELSLEIIQMWISNSWNRILSQKLKLRSTISIKDRSGYFNMTSNKWEERSFFS